MDSGTLILSGLDENRIKESINVIAQQYNDGIMPKIVDDYNRERFTKVVK